MLVRITILLALLLLSIQSNATTSVWQAKKGDNIVYLAGTVHILQPQDYPLPAEFDYVFNQSDIAVFEADINAANDPDVAQQLLEIRSLPQGKTISDYVNRRTYKSIRDFFTNNGLNFVQVQNLKPGLIAMTMNIIALRQQGFTQHGVDQIYMEKASKTNKPVLYLESMVEQIQMLAELGKGYEDEFFQYTIEDIQNISAQLQPLMAAWRIGDVETMKQTSLAEMQKDYPKMYEDLIVNRNLAWLERIQLMAATPEVEVIFGGVLHFPGNDGVLALLENNGFTISQVKI